MARNIAGRVTQTSGQNGGTVGVPNLFHSNAVPGGSGAIAQIPPPYAYVMAYDHRTSYTMQYLANVQRQVGGNAIYNPAAFVEAAPGTFGDAARNLIEGPGIINLDAEVHKEFHVPCRESHVMQFRLEAFNAPNYPNWSLPNLNILSNQTLPGQPGTNAHQNFGLVNGTPRACGSSRLDWSTAFQTKGTLWKNELAEVF